jgi:anti-sigma B factor antagonist
VSGKGIFFIPSPPKNRPKITIDLFSFRGSRGRESAGFPVQIATESADFSSELKRGLSYIRKRCCRSLCRRRRRCLRRSTTPCVIASKQCQSNLRTYYLRIVHSPVRAQGSLIAQIKSSVECQNAHCGKKQRLSQDKEPKLRLSLEARVTEDVTVISCKGRIAYGAEAAALSGEFAELAPQTRRVVIDLSGVEMIDAAGLGALISVALTAQASQCSVKLAAPGNLIRELLDLTKLTSVFEVHPTLDAATVASRGQAA